MVNSAMVNLKAADTNNIYIDSIIVNIPRHDILIDSQYSSYSLNRSPHADMISFANRKPGYVIECNNKRSRFFSYNNDYILARNFILQDSNHLATVFFKINMHQFYRTIVSEFPAKTDIYIYNADGVGVFQEDVNYSLIDLSAGELQSLLTGERDQFQQKDYTYLCYSAPSTGWKVISKIDASLLTPQIDTLLRLLLPILCITILGAVLISIIVSLDIYSPLRNMFDYVFNGPFSGHSNTSASKNEIDYITYAFSEVNTTITRMQDIIDSLSPDVISRIFTDLINNRAPSYEYVKTSLQSIQSPFKFDSIYVAAAMAFPLEYDLEGDDSNYKKLVDILSAFHDRTGANSFVKFMEDNIIIIVISFEATTDINEAHRVIDKMETLLSGYFNKDGVEIIYARGHFYHSILDVTASYHRAIGLIHKARSANSATDSVDKEQAAPLPGLNSETSRAYSDESKEALRYQILPILAEIEAQRTKEAITALNNVFSNLCTYKPIGDSEALSLASFLELFTDALDGRDLTEEALTNRARALQAKCGNTSAEGTAILLDELRNLFYDLVYTAQNQYKIMQNQYLLKAKEYISMNYANSYLSLETIAEECGITPNYLSKIFVLSGTHYLEYLNHYRVSKSISLLRESKKTISEIAGACGFNSSQSFIRVFKKQMGEPPGKFRKF
jgi:AraC-like DNA-binding protein